MKTCVRTRVKYVRIVCLFPVVVVAVTVAGDNIVLLLVDEFTKKEKKSEERCASVLINKRDCRIVVTLVIAVFITEIDDGKSIQAHEFVFSLGKACASLSLRSSNMCLCMGT